MLNILVEVLSLNMFNVMNLMNYFFFLRENFKLYILDF